METKLSEPPVSARWRNRLFFLFRYGVAGATGGVLQTLVLYVWVSLLGLARIYQGGVVLGFVIALIVTFLLQKFWTFRDSSSERTRRQFVIYAGIALGSLVLNTLLLAGAKTLLEHKGIDFFHGWYILAEIAIILLVAMASFVLNYFFTFTNTERTYHIKKPHQQSET